MRKRKQPRLKDLEDSALEPSTPEKIQVKAAFHKASDPTATEDIALCKKLARTELRLKDLESAVTKAVSEKVDAEAAAADAREQTGLAVDHQEDLSAALDVKAASLQRLQDDLASVVRERDAAAAQVTEASSSISRVEQELQQSNATIAKLEHRLQAQSGEKRSSDRRARDLEIRISSLAAARAQSNSTHDADLQAAQQEAEGLRVERDRSQQELKRFKDMAGQVQRKVEATGAVMSKMNADLESGAKDKERLQNLLAAEQHRSAGLGAHLNAAKRRLRDLEGELQITRETLRNTEERLRRILQERHSLQQQLASR
ncbi:hypothetical protein WJX74_000066 [Apatococcus lobatus]|uniref:Uncharacterized protein n=1 Tax=Apatococcus lobatus TaxID=904363 RepID=A0AAW1QCS0_9CHLO